MSGSQGMAVFRHDAWRRCWTRTALRPLIRCPFMLRDSDRLRHLSIWAIESLDMGQNSIPPFLLGETRHLPAKVAVREAGQGEASLRIVARVTTSANGPLERHDGARETLLAPPGLRVHHHDLQRIPEDVVLPQLCLGRW